MPDPNAPMDISPEEAEAALAAMTPEERERLKTLNAAAEAEKASEAPGKVGSESAEPSSPPTNAPSESTEKPYVAESSNESPREGTSSNPTSQDGDDSEGVNQNEVGIVEMELADLDEDIGSETRDVSVTCHKCGHKIDTMVTRKQFDDQVKNSSAQPKFQTKCKFCNYDSTYVLTGEGTETIA